MSQEFNSRSGKPFYVELSIGIYGFSCKEETDLNELLQKSDEMLYQAKIKRRKNVKKINTP